MKAHCPTCSKDFETPLPTRPTRQGATHVRVFHNCGLRWGPGLKEYGIPAGLMQTYTPVDLPIEIYDSRGHS